MGPAVPPALSIEGLSLPPPVAPPLLGVSPALGPTAAPAMGMEALKLQPPVLAPVLGATAALQPAGMPAAELTLQLPAAGHLLAPPAQLAAPQLSSGSLQAPAAQLPPEPAPELQSAPAAMALAAEQEAGQQPRAAVPAAVVEPSLALPVPAAEPLGEQQLPEVTAAEPAGQAQMPAAEPMAVDCAAQGAPPAVPLPAEEVPAEAAPAGLQSAAAPPVNNCSIATEPLAVAAAAPNGSLQPEVKVEHEEPLPAAGFDAAPMACMQQPAALAGLPPAAQAAEVRQLRDPSLQPISGTIGHRRGRGNGQPALADVELSRPKRTVRRPARRFDEDFEAPEPDSDEVRRNGETPCQSIDLIGAWGRPLPWVQGLHCLDGWQQRQGSLPWDIW